MEEILEEHCRFLRGKRVTSDDIREGLVELVRGDKLRRLVLRRVLKAFGRTADDYVKNVLKDLAKANVNLPTYLSTAYEIPYFPGLREDSSMKVPKKWIDEKKVRNVLERFEKNFEVVFSAPTDTKVPVDFVEIVGMIRSVIPTKRLYDIRVFNVPQGNVLVQGSNMLCAIRIYIDKETRTLDLGYASRVEKSKYLEIRVWNSNMSDEECDVMVEILGHVWNYEYALKSCDGETYCQGQQCEAELPLAVAIRHYLKENKQYEDQALEKKIRRMRSVFGDTHRAYVQNVLADLLATKTRVPVIRNCPKVHLDGTYWPGLYTPGPFYSAKDLEWTQKLSELSEDMRKEGLCLIDAMMRKTKNMEIDFDDNYNETYGVHGTKSLSGEEGSWKILTLSNANGEENPEAQRFAPKTLEFLRRVPRKCGSACLSVLRPGAKILLHRGPSNCRVTCHFGIVVPKGDGLYIRVGAEKRHWKEGKWLLFDDSYPHMVRNDTNGWRCVLIVDVWNPSLSDLECEMLREVAHDAASRSNCGCAIC